MSSIIGNLAIKVAYARENEIKGLGYEREEEISSVFDKIMNKIDDAKSKIFQSPNLNDSKE